MARSGAPRPRWAWVAALLLVPGTAASRDVDVTPWDFTPATGTSICAAARSGTESAPLALALALRADAAGRGGSRAGARPDGGAPAAVLGAGRAQVLLQSLTVPGWGQATLGHRRAAGFFLVTEAAVWGSYTAFRIQSVMREDTYLRTATLFAGIDLSGRDEEFRRIVGSFLSSEEYNRLVVARDAANLYYDDPTAYRAYLEAHSLRGSDGWQWSGLDQLLRFRGQRKDAQRAGQRANTALAVAVVNRFVSALHAARLAGHPARPVGWNFQAVPVDGPDPTAFRFQVSRSF